MYKDIAVIGISGRFPQADSMEDFYQNLQQGRDSIRPLSDTRKHDTGLKYDENYWMLAYLEDIDKFDADFFGVSPAEAETMDPHQRLLLQIAYETFENAGYNVDHYSGSNTAVFLADTHQRYYTLANRYDPLLITGNANAVTAGRIARFFNLWGTALMVDTACSSSLVAIHLACQEIHLGACDQALVCAANLQIFPEPRGNSDGVGIMSSDGKNRTFSANATGTGSGEAVVGVLLKPLDQALADGDMIQAIINGTAVNQDAQRSSSLTAPSTNAQAEVLKKAWRKSGIDPTTISYIEAHGTATPLGDPIEVDAINLAFREFTERKQFCALSSAKSNLGHTNFAAGIVGFVKVVLSLKNKQLFPSLHFEDPNPFIDFVNSATYVNTELKEWHCPEGQVRRAGVSSFGISGTNCHVVLQEAPARSKPAEPSTSELIVISSKTKTGLQKNIKALISWLETQPAMTLKEVSYITTKGRKHFDCRYVTMATDVPSLLSRLKEIIKRDLPTQLHNAPVWFAFSGNVDIGDEQLTIFSDQFPRFKQTVNECVHLLPKCSFDGNLRRFVFQLALCNVLLDKGIRITQVLGTGTGKLVIALLQKKTSLEKALQEVKEFADPKDDIKQRLTEFIQAKIAGRGAYILELGPPAEVSATLRLLRSNSDNFEVGEFDNASNEQLLDIVRQLYVRNSDINWNEWWKGQLIQRIEMPVYQFEPIRYWLDQTTSSTAAQEQRIEDWFHELKWVPQRLEEKRKEQKNKTYLVVSNGVCRNPLWSALEENGHTCIHVLVGIQFRRVAAKQFEIGTKEEDCVKLLTAFQSCGWDFNGAIIIGSSAALPMDVNELEAELSRSLYVYTHVLKSLVSHLFKQRFQIVHLSEKSQAVTGDVISPVGHAVFALFKALQSDFPFADVRAIDMDESFTTHDLTQEIGIEPTQKIVAYRAGKRYVQQLERIIIEGMPQSKLNTKQGGVYLVTGGASGVGLEVSKALAANSDCHIIIIGRTLLPPRAEWNAFNQSITTSAGERIKDLLELEQNGCSMEYHACDVADSVGMKQIIDYVYSKYRRIDGVMHVSGTMLYKPMADMSIAALKDTIRPKVQGTVVLANLVDLSKLDWFILFSSLNSIVPQKNTLAYTVANAFEDGCAQWLRSRGVNAMAINWGAWGEAGQGRRDISSKINQEATLRAWSNKQGIQSLGIAMALGHPQPIVADVSWKAFLNNPFFKINQPGGHQYAIDDAELNGLTEVQAKLLQIWYDVLKVKKININNSFFDLGGHSLLAARLVNLIEEQFDVQLKFKDVLEYPVFEQQSEYIQQKMEHTTPGSFSLIPNIEEQDYYRISHAQKRLWILDHLEKGNATNYNITQVFHFNGKFNKPAFENAFHELIRRHEILRTTFVLIDEEPFQKVRLQENSEMEISYIEIRNESADMQAIVGVEACFEFDLEKGPLMRVLLVQTGPEQFACVLTMHHIISDGWSISILRKEITNLYQGFGTTYRIPEPLRIQYKDFSAWQARQLSGEQLEKHRAYWKSQFSGDFQRLEFPADYSRSAVNRHRGASLLLKGLPATALDVVARANGASLFMVLITTIKVLLYRYTGQSDVIIGAPFACRHHRDLENQIGFYVNTLPLRTALDIDNGFLTNLARVKETILGVTEHENYPFDLLVDELKIDRDVNRSPIFDIVVTLQVDETVVADNWGSTGTEAQIQEGASKFDLFFEFIQKDDQLGLAVNYNPDLYQKPRIERMLQHYRNIVENITADQHLSVARLNMLSPEETQQLLVDFNQQLPLVEPSRTFHQYFEHWVEKSPDAVALVFNDKAFTYNELNERANRLAHYLRSAFAVRPDTVIGVVLERSANLMIAILGVLKAGGAYLPIAPDFPEERKRYLIKDGEVDIVLTDQLCDWIDPEQVIMVDDDLLTNTQIVAVNPKHINSIQDLAYVIYTSGTTGTPKGVMIQHDTIVTTLINQSRQYSIDSTDRILQFATITFDASIYEIGLAFCTGATLVMMDKDTLLDNLALMDYVRSQLITWTLLPPSYLSVLDPAALTSLRSVVTGGEAANLKKAHECLPYFKYYNAYGPTECSVVATLHQVTHDVQDGDILPIGRPQGGTRIYILDKNNNVLPLGVPGELCIGGKSVGRGYLNRPELTAEKFITSPFAKNERIYLTGDLAYWRADGTVVFCGRKDNQVKVRGYRIELDEIQRTLLADPQVNDAIVVVCKDAEHGDDVVAYLTMEEGEKLDAVRSKLQLTLPAYMIPSHFIVLEDLPLKPNGKIDKERLPSPAFDRAADNTMSSATEDIMRSIWREILGLDVLQGTDDFFKIGGDSLKAIKMRGRITKVFSKQLSIKDIFNFPTIQKLSRLIEQASNDNYNSIYPVPVQRDYSLSHAQRRLWVLDQTNGERHAYNVFGSLLIEGPLHVPALEHAFTILIQRHEILRTVFVTVQGEPRQRILDAQDASFKIDYADVSGNAAAEEKAYQLRDAETGKAFNLASDCLVRVQLIYMGEERHIFGLTMHHIIADGWSLEILIHEILTLYNAYNKKSTVVLAPLKIHYKDYAYWHNRQLSGSGLEQLRKYWQSKLSGRLPILDLPLDYPRPERKTYRGANCPLTITPESSGALKKMGRQHDASLFMVLLAAVKALLFRYTLQKDLIVGAVTAGRNHTDLENQIGYYLNTIALRTSIQPNDSFSDLLFKVKQTVVEAFDHEAYPFDLLINDLDIERDVSRSPVFDVLVNLQSMQGIYQKGEQELQGLHVKELPTPVSTSKYDLTFIFRETGSGISLVLLYNTDLFKTETVSLLLQRFNSLINAAVENPGIALEDIALTAVRPVQHRAVELNFDF